MSIIRNRLLGMCVAAASLGAIAQTADEHKDHHPASNSSAVPAQKAPMGAAPMAGMPKMDEHMKAMQSMHEKMMAAKTPETRQALMAEHMKLMQDGMSMMKKMCNEIPKGKKIADRQQMMEKCMEMMESMMQMMMDRQPVSPAN